MKLLDETLLELAHFLITNPVETDVYFSGYNETFVFNSSQNFFEVSLPEQSADVPEPDELLLARLQFAGVPPLCVAIDPGAADIRFLVDGKHLVWYLSGSVLAFPT